MFGGFQNALATSRKTPPARMRTGSCHFWWL